MGPQFSIMPAVSPVSCSSPMNPSADFMLSVSVFYIIYSEGLKGLKIQN